MRFDGSAAAGFTLLFRAALWLTAAPMHPVEWWLHDELAGHKG